MPVKIEVRPQGEQWQVFIDDKAPFEPMDKAAADKLADFLRFNRDNKTARIDSRAMKT